MRSRSDGRVVSAPRFLRRDTRSPDSLSRRNGPGPDGRYALPRQQAQTKLAAGLIPRRSRWQPSVRQCHPREAGTARPRSPRCRPRSIRAKPVHPRSLGEVFGRGPAGQTTTAFHLARVWRPTGWRLGAAFGWNALLALGSHLPGINRPMMACLADSAIPAGAAHRPKRTKKGRAEKPGQSNREVKEARAYRRCFQKAI